MIIKMRVIVFGRERMIKKLSVFLAREGIEMVGTSDRVDKMITLPEQGGFDLAIVDSQAETTEAACHHIKEIWDMPVVLIVNRRQADWERLQSLDADGYLAEEAENGELVARLRAMLRRLCPVRRVEKMSLCHSTSEFQQNLNVNFMAS